MDKIKVVVFGPNGAKVLTNPWRVEYITQPHLVNPDLTHVRGLPPEEWALLEGKVRPKDLRVNVVSSPIVKKPIVIPKRPFWRPYYKGIVVGFLGAAVLISFYEIICYLTKS